MNSINQVWLRGRIGMKELQPAKHMQPRSRFSLATREHRTDRDSFTCWHRIIAEGPQALEWYDAFSVGQVIQVRGRLESRTYQDKKTREQRFLTEVFAMTIEPVEDSLIESGFSHAPDARAKAANDEPVWPEEL